MPYIDTATRCSCGAPVTLVEPYPGEWQAYCRDCYDGTEDAPSVQHVAGTGATPDAALWGWQGQHDGTLGIEWHPVTTVIELEQQITAERARQRGWTVTVPDEFVEHVCYGPPCAAESESNV